jgi:polar amino acid transport system substrate-binding protein
VATTRDRNAATIDFLRDVVEELKATGFVDDALDRAGRTDVTVARPA